MKYIYTISIILLSALCAGCSSDNSELKLAHKGAKTPLMQAIADYHDNIYFIEEDTSYDLINGIRITEASFKYLTRKTKLFIAEIDLQSNLSIIASKTDSEHIITGQTIPQQMQNEINSGENVLLGINGDFYGVNSSNGHLFSMNIFAKNGEVIKDTYSPGYEGIFAILKNGSSKIISSTEFSAIQSDIEHAVGGYQFLVRKGKENEDIGYNDMTMGFNPRTFIGLSENEKKCFLFVVDGRNKEHSEGMRLEDVATLCKGAGCYNAFNLDGGGSSTFVIKNKSNELKVLNKPSDGEVRPVYNGLIVVEK